MASQTSKQQNYPIFLRLEDEDEANMILIEFYNLSHTSREEIKELENQILPRGTLQVQKDYISLVKGKIELLDRLIIQLAKITNNEKEPKFS